MEATVTKPSKLLARLVSTATKQTLQAGINNALLEPMQSPQEQTQLLVLNVQVATPVTKRALLLILIKALAMPIHTLLHKDFLL